MTMKRWLVLGLVAGVWGCGGAEQAPPTLLVADPPPTEDGATPGAGMSDLDRGVAYIEKEAWSEAVTHLERALQAQPGAADAHYYLAVAKQRLGDHKAAEEGFERAVALDNNLHLARAHLGELYLTGDPLRAAEAIKTLEPAAAALPKDADVQQLLAFAYRAEGKWDKSDKHYQASLAIEDSPKVRFDYADMLFEAERMDKAVVQMRKLLPLHAKDVQVTAQLAHRFAKAKAYADCKAAFTSAIELDKQQPAFYLHRGLCRHSLAEAEDTVRNDYNKALEIDPKFQPAWYYLGMSWLDSKKQQKALDAFDQCIKLGKGTPVGKKAVEQIAAMKQAAKAR